MAAVADPADFLAERAPVLRKKFATPPVKVACLSCRASRTRCDGGTPCVSCVNRGQECVYRPSRRGGPRHRKKVSSSPRRSQRSPPSNENTHDPTLVRGTGPQEPLPIQNYVDPGAGLNRLQDGSQDSDFIFDSLFLGGVSSFEYDELPVEVETAMSQVPMVRTYQSDQAILDAYYIWIHPFFPILPPPRTSQLKDQVQPSLQNQFDQPFEPSSPVGMAISAILALIPCPEDTNHQVQESILFRRRYAQFLAQSAIESIERESEIPDSSIEPQKALSESPRASPDREPFHPGLPIELESIVALDILSVYEYAQRGNLKKMRSRASEAFAAAMMNLSLHTLGHEDDHYAEAKRRVWWMTFVCACQGSIVSNTPPSFDVFTPSFTTEFPTLDVDPEAWPMFIQSQRAILAATQFVMELNAAIQSHADMGPIYQRMKELDTFIEPLIEQSEAWTLEGPLVAQVEPTERLLARSLRAMARIKLNSARIKVHRYCAFYDLPVFSGKHCDLASTTEKQGQEPRLWPSCGCSSFNQVSPNSSGFTRSSNESPAISTPANTAAGTPASNPSVPDNLPFSSHYSAKVCLRSALNIAQSFDSLPYPNPSGNVDAGLPFLSPTSALVAPRTMPSFACCAMQSAYSLLMIHHKTKAMYPAGGDNPLVGNMLLRLQQGLASIAAALENYATAFEALGGMRDQIRIAVESSMVFE